MISVQALNRELRRGSAYSVNLIQIDPFGGSLMPVYLYTVELRSKGFQGTDPIFPID